MIIKIFGKLYIYIAHREKVRGCVLGALYALYLIITTKQVWGININTTEAFDS